MGSNYFNLDTILDDLLLERQSYRGRQGRASLKSSRADIRTRQQNQKANAPEQQNSPNKSKVSQVAGEDQETTNDNTEVEDKEVDLKNGEDISKDIMKVISTFSADKIVEMSDAEKVLVLTAVRKDMSGKSLEDLTNLGNKTLQFVVKAISEKVKTIKFLTVKATIFPPKTTDLKNKIEVAQPSYVTKPQAIDTHVNRFPVMKASVLNLKKLLTTNRMMDKTSGVFFFLYKDISKNIKIVIVTAGDKSGKAAEDRNVVENSMQVMSDILKTELIQEFYNRLYDGIATNAKPLSQLGEVVTMNTQPQQAEEGDSQTPETTTPASGSAPAGGTTT